MELNHINIRAADQEAMRDFLVLTLGLTVGPRPPFDFHGYWLYMDDQPVIHLQGTDRSPTTSPTGWIDHVAFGPFNLEEKCAELEKAGVAFTVAGVPGTALRQIFVNGPEGVKIELQCPSDA